MRANRQHPPRQLLRCIPIASLTASIRRVPILSSLIVALATAPAMAAGTVCPLTGKSLAAEPDASHAVPEDPTCLVDARKLGAQDVLDLRPRGDYLAWHLPQAQHLSPSVVATARRGKETPFVAYDSGKSRSATFLLCSQLRRAGLTRFKLVDGGIAALAQAGGRSEVMTTNRLGDGELMAAITDRHTSTTALAAPLREMLAEHRIGVGPGRNGRRVVIADPATPLSSVQAQLGADQRTTFYWIGTAAQLRELIHSHLLQHNKRLAGPAQSLACSAL